MKKRIKELETTLQNCKIRIESRDHIMGKVVVQIREVANHIQTLAVQADILSVKYELETDRGQELALLLKKIRILTKTKDMDQRLERLEQFQKEMANERAA
ncbi:hypothetical protein Goklo_024119 [Gossypium klotzschianum]|uniref:Uncharacterized protein n=1 Tax=Gossypium klotzschianum TaxID=34286 RepID=A0A7J8W9B9_9ROSI|nr:hypothetical protein [Gossypium klotzschianum]